MQWSVYFQNPEFLEYTRLFLIQPELKPLVRAWCGIRDGMKILDVGCGTGYFTRLLAEGGENAAITGLDLEEPFIAYAKEQAEKQKLDIRFLVGDALSLPFEDESFDLVTSHTFLTSVPDPERAMDEMKRVLRPGGCVASVTTMSYLPFMQYIGEYPPECAWVSEFRKLEEQINQAYYTLDSILPRIAGVKPAAVPRFFAARGLENICAYPIGKMVCLSNAAVSREEKLEWIRLYQASELKKLDAYMRLEQMRDLISASDAQRYRLLIQEKCKWLTAHTDENAVWDMQGGANLLITGRKPE